MGSGDSRPAHHIDSRSSAPLAARPQVVNPRHLTASMRWRGTSFGADAAVLSAYESSRDLRAAVREVDERWTELHWIHGDLTVSNVQVALRPAMRVSFLGLDEAGLGDPAWDLAIAVDMITWVSPCWHAMPQPLADYPVGIPASERTRPALSGHGGQRHWLPPSGSRTPHGSTGQDPGESELAIWLDRAHAYAARRMPSMAVA